MAAAPPGSDATAANTLSASACNGGDAVRDVLPTTGRCAPAFSMSPRYAMALLERTAEHVRFFNYISAACHANHKKTTQFPLTQFIN
eukprot:scaffold59161_cov36-Prasinocladus_malaysianus.AAC.1